MDSIQAVSAARSQEGPLSSGFPVGRKQVCGQAKICLYWFMDLGGDGLVQEYRVRAIFLLFLSRTASPRLCTCWGQASDSGPYSGAEGEGLPQP